MRKIQILFILFLASSLYSNTNFRVMSYNALNFDGTSRLSDFQTVFENSEPDILICQEIKSEAASDVMLNILNTAIGGYARAAFVYDGDINNMLYYKTSIGTLISQDEINTSPRDISEYVMNIDGSTIRFYSCHLKASDDSSYEAERLAAVTILRSHLNALPTGTEFIIAGDMNFYTSSENGYQKFIAYEENNIGRAEDLCSEVGSWHNSATYAPVHSQSTRVENFGSGASGGMDDKFDFIFGNYGINNGSGIEYSSSSFTSYGNDGAHFNISINTGTNSAVSAIVADALYYASDHLPVYADFVSISGGGVTEETNLIISQYYEGASYNKWIELTNIHISEEIDLANPQLYLVLYSNENADAPTNSNFNSINLLTGSISALNSVLYQHVSAILPSYASGTIASACNFNGNDLMILTSSNTTPWDSRIDIVGNGDSWGEDTSFCRKSSINMGSQNFTLFNWDEYTNTAVNNAIVGSTERLGEHFIDTPLPVTLSSFTASYSNDTPIIQWETESESANLGWNVYRANSSNLGQASILNLNTIPGNGTTTEPSYYSFADEYEIQFNFTYWYWLESIAISGETEIFGPVALTIPLDNNFVQEIPVATELHQNFPNPFNPNTSISFDIKENETGILTIYNIRGQLILTKEFKAGRQNYIWGASEQASGIYLYKLHTDSYSNLMKMLLIK